MIGFVASTRALRTRARVHSVSDSTGRLLASAAAGAGGLFAATLVSPSQFAVHEILLPVMGIGLAAVTMAMGFRALLVPSAAVIGILAFIELLGRNEPAAPVIAWRTALVPLFSFAVATSLATWWLCRQVQAVRGVVLPFGAAAILVLFWSLPIAATVVVAEQGRTLAAGVLLIAPALLLAPAFTWLEASRGMRTAGTMDVRDGVARIVGSPAALLAGLWIASWTASIARRLLAGGPLEALASPAAWSAGAIVAAVAVWALWRTPRNFYERQLRGRLHPRASSDSIWFLLLAGLSGSALDIALAGPTLGWASWTVLAAALAYGLVRVRLSAPQGSGAAPLWIVLLERPRWAGRAVVHWLASAWRIGPVTIVAPPDAAPVIGGAHLRAAAATERLTHLFPLRASHLVDWEDNLPPTGLWHSLPVREIYAHPVLWQEMLGKRVTPGSTVIALRRQRNKGSRIVRALFGFESKGPGDLRTLRLAWRGLSGLKGGFVSPSDAARLGPMTRAERPAKVGGASPESLFRELRTMKPARTGVRHILIVHHGVDAEFAASLSEALMNRHDRDAPAIETWAVAIDAESWRRHRYWIVPVAFWRHAFRLALPLFARAGIVLGGLSTLLFSALAARGGEYEMAILEAETPGGRSTLGEFMLALATHRVPRSVISVRSMRPRDEVLLLNSHWYSGTLYWSASSSMSERCEEIASGLLEPRFMPPQPSAAETEPVAEPVVVESPADAEASADVERPLELYIALMPDVAEFRGPLMDALDHRRDVRRTIAVVREEFLDTKSIAAGAAWEDELQARLDDRARETAEARLAAADAYVLILGSSASARAAETVRHDLDEVDRRGLPSLIFQRLADRGTEPEVRPEGPDEDLVSALLQSDLRSQTLVTSFRDRQELLSQLFAYLPDVLSAGNRWRSEEGDQRVVPTAPVAARTYRSMPHKELHHEFGVVHAGFRPDGQAVVTVDDDSTARIWNVVAVVETGVMMRDVHRAQFSPDGRLLAVIGDKPGVGLWNAATGRLMMRIETREQIVAASFSNDGSRIVVATRDGTARVWQLPSGAAMSWRPLRHQGPVLGASFSPDGTRILTSGEDRTVCLWDGESGERLASIAHAGPVRVALFSPDGRLVATADDDGMVRLWDAVNLSPFGREMQHGRMVNQVVFSPDGRLVATASDDGLSYLWEAAWSGMSRSLRHPDAVRSVAFSRDSRQMATACHDGCVRVWDASTGEPAGPPILLDGSAAFVEFGPDGRTLLTMDGSRSAKLLQLDSTHA